MTAIAEGAAIASAILAGQIDDKDFFVSTEHALGTEVFDPTTGTSHFDVLIPRNHKLPARVTKTYFPVRDFQEALDVSVLEGDPELPLGHIDNATLKEWSVPILQPGPSNETAIDITFAYDVDGILNVTAVGPKEQVLLNADVSFGATADKSNLVRIARAANEALSQGRLGGDSSGAPSSSTSVNHADVTNARTRIMPFVDDAEAKRIEDVCERVVAGDSSAASELASIVAMYSYLL